VKVPDNPRDPDIERRLEKWAGFDPGLRFSPELRRNVLGKLAPSLTPVKLLPRQSVLVLRFLGVFAVLSAGLVAIMSKAGFHRMTTAQIGWMALVLAGGALLFSFSLAAQMVPGRRSRLRFFMVLALPGSGAIAGIVLNFPWLTSRGFVSEGWPCAAMEVTMAIPAALVFWLLARRGALFASAKLGAALAGLAVFVALIPLQSQCMFLQAPHLLAWHGGTAALLIGLGALIGSRRQHRWRV
jgi:hypothetical protein